MNKAIVLVLIAAASAATGLSAREPGLSRSAQRGLVFAHQRCAACHGVTPNTTSPNPESPPFEDVANMPGLTQATLRRFLSDSHNFPGAMNFTVTRTQIRDLSAYIVTMKKTGYRPLP